MPCTQLLIVKPDIILQKSLLTARSGNGISHIIKNVKCFTLQQLDPGWRDRETRPVSALCILNHNWVEQSWRKTPTNWTLSIGKFCCFYECHILLPWWS